MTTDIQEYGDDELFCLWPDGTYCLMEDLEDFLTMMSDDYEVLYPNTPKYTQLLIDEFNEDLGQLYD